MTSSYADDLAFLRKHTDVVELSATGKARVAVAPKYQGRVMTSMLGGESFGWLNRRFIDSGRQDPKFNNYGGEDRFWLGPEAGQFGLWFKKGEPFDSDHWCTPAGFDSGTFEVTSQGARSVAMAAHFRVANYSGTEFHCAVRRVVHTMDAGKFALSAGCAPPEGVAMVGFESVNTLANVGKSPWARESGLLSVWILGQFKPLPAGRVIVPFAPGEDVSLGPKATTDYFGPLSPERCRIADGYLLFACDGRYRSKIGVSPKRARGMLGSFDPDEGVLTIVEFNLPCGAPALPYVNSLWKMQDDPFAGDVVNSYNDGEVTPGAAQLGPFYEIETSSPASELPPGGAMVHVHRTYHFSGGIEGLRLIARRTLGMELSEI